MWIVCQADSSHEMFGFIFSEKYNEIKLSSTEVVISMLRIKARSVSISDIWEKS